MPSPTRAERETMILYRINDVLTALAGELGVVTVGSPDAPDAPFVLSDEDLNDLTHHVFGVFNIDVPA